MRSQDVLMIAANLLLLVHFLYVMTAVIGQLLIIIGGLLHWTFVRRPIVRSIHLLMILFVAFLDLTNRPCPLTVWENRLREQAGGLAAWEMTFVERLLRSIVFMPLPASFFEFMYIGFAALVLLSFFIVPPRRQPKNEK